MAVAKTIDSAAAAYISDTEVYDRCDVRVLADLCSDASARLGSSTDIALMKTALTASTAFIALKRDACGEVESYALQGGRYKPQDLTALAAHNSMGKGKLLRLLVRLIVVMAYERRPDREMKQPWILETVGDELQALRDGIAIFSFVEAEEAGVVSSRIETAAQVEARGGLPYIARRLFGRRSNRIDRG